MIIEIDMRVFEEARYEQALDALLLLLESGRHGWVSPDLEEIRQTSWYQREGTRRRRRMDELVRAGERNRKAHLKVGLTTRPGVPWELSVSAAVNLLSAPLRVLVENAQSDGRLIELVLLRVGEKLLRRTRGYDAAQAIRAGWRRDIGCRGWVELEHGGGGTLAARLEALCAEPHPGPVLVLLDGDRAHPAAEPGRTAQDALAAAARGRRANTDVLAGWVPLVHVLAQREVENYIPDCALRAGHGRRAEDVLGLRADQRACWDHKRGLRSELELGRGEEPGPDGTTWRWRDPKVKALYADTTVSPVLERGLGRDVWQCLLDDDHTTARDLRERGGEEMERLAQLLAGAL